MNAREQAHQLSAAIATATARLNTLEKETYWYEGKRDEITRLKRVIRALDRDLDKIVATIPAPVQFDFFSSVEPRQSALEKPDQKIPSKKKRKILDPSPNSVDRHQLSETEG